MARPGVAAEPAHQRQDVPLEVGDLGDVVGGEPLACGAQYGGSAFLVGPGGRRQDERGGERGERERSVHGWRSPFVVVAAGSALFASVLTSTCACAFGFAFGLAATPFRFCWRARWPFFTKA